MSRSFVPLCSSTSRIMLLLTKQVAVSENSFCVLWFSGNPHHASYVSVTASKLSHCLLKSLSHLVHMSSFAQMHQFVTDGCYIFLSISSLCLQMYIFALVAVKHHWHWAETDHSFSSAEFSERIGQKWPVLLNKHCFCGFGLVGLWWTCFLFPFPPNPSGISQLELVFLSDICHLVIDVLFRLLLLEMFCLWGKNAHCVY